MKPTVTIHHLSARAKNWQTVFGRLDHIPVTERFPQVLSFAFPGLEANTLCYLLDLSRVTSLERVRLIRHLMATFPEAQDQIVENLAQISCPLLAENVWLDEPGPAPQGDDDEELDLGHNEDDELEAASEYDEDDLD